jgi:hypothetical protein
MFRIVKPKICQTKLKLIVIYNNRRLIEWYLVSGWANWNDGGRPDPGDTLQCCLGTNQQNSQLLVMDNLHMYNVLLFLNRSQSHDRELQRRE